MFQLLFLNKKYSYSYMKNKMRELKNEESNQMQGPPKMSLSCHRENPNHSYFLCAKRQFKEKVGLAVLMQDH